GAIGAVARGRARRRGGRRRRSAVPALRSTRLRAGRLSVSGLGPPRAGRGGGGTRARTGHSKRPPLTSAPKTPTPNSDPKLRPQTPTQTPTPNSDPVSGSVTVSGK